jgi:hypothetical protein
MDLLRDATHVFCGDNGNLRHGGVVHGVPVYDTLASGPSALDREKHRRMRRQFWRGEYALLKAPWNLGRQPRWPRNGPIALWTSTGVIDQLFYWNAVDRLAGHELWRIDASLPDHQIDRIGTLPPDFVAYSAKLARRVNTRELSSAKRRWRAFASGEVRDLMGAVNGEPAILNWLHKLLPRKTGQLQLSRFDEMLLSPFAVWNTRGSALGHWIDLVNEMGDLVLLTRLLRWEQAGALSSRPAIGKSQWSNRELQLTPLGLRLIRGMRSLDEAPPMFIGGHEAYGPRSWLLTSSGSLRRA